MTSQIAAAKILVALFMLLPLTTLAHGKPKHHTKPKQCAPSQDDETGPVSLTTPPLIIHYLDQAMCAAANMGTVPFEVTIEVIDLHTGEVINMEEEWPPTWTQPPVGPQTYTIEPNRVANSYYISEGGYSIACKFTIDSAYRDALRASICGRIIKYPGTETSSTCTVALAAQ